MAYVVVPGSNDTLEYDNGATTSLYSDSAAGANSAISSGVRTYTKPGTSDTVQSYVRARIKGAINEITYSEDFSASPGGWTENKMTVTTNQTDSPIRTNTADKFTETTQNVTHQVYKSLAYTANDVRTWSAHFKDNDRRYVIMICSNGSTNHFHAVFDLQDGVITQTGSGAGGTLTSSRMEEKENGWYRCSVTGSTTSGSNLFYKMLLSDTATPTITSFGNYARTGDGSSSVFVWGAMKTSGANIRKYVKTEGSISSTVEIGELSKTYYDNQ